MLETASNHHQRQQSLRKWGDFSLAYSTAVQPGLMRFEYEDGYLAYAAKWGYVYVLGDPVVSPKKSAELLDAFLGEFPNAGFFQASRSLAAALSQRNFYVNEMGVDTRIELDTYDFRGKEKEAIRYASNWLARRAYVIEEVEIDEERSDEFQQLSEDWRATRTIKNREVTFLNRPIEFHYEPGVRRFVLRDFRGDMQAFVFFDPLYRDQEVVGYVTSFKRRRPDAPKVAEQGIMRYAINIFKSEQRSVLKLGLSPFAGIKNNEFRCNPFLHYSFRYLYRAGWVNRWLYNLTGHYKFKQRFRGVEEPTYFASRTLVNDLRLTGLMRLCRII